MLILGWHQPVVLPLKLLVVLFHELGHAAVALATGGQVLEVHVGLDQGGHTLTRGGLPLLILNSGYLGSVLGGMGLLVAAGRLRGTRHGWALFGLRMVGLVCVLGAVVDLRDDLLGAPVGTVTDATLLADATGVPALAWGAAWAVAGGVLLWRLRGSLG